MIITIVQSEIEQAITAFIKSQINVADGMEISIELRATRGTEGYQAVIDIAPKGSPKTVAAEVVQQTTVVATKPAAIKEPELKKDNWPIPADEPATCTPTPATVTEAGEVQLNPESGMVEAVVVPPKNIFSGLKKPVNPKPEAE